MTSSSCFLCKSELKKDKDEEIFLIARFPLNEKINVNDLNGVTEKDQIKHKL